MKRKDDDLLRLAFGELSADAARAVEAKASGDASSRAELEAFRDLRNGLQNLPPPPPDNLSADRLRAAILDGELKARRAGPFSWSQFGVLVPAALAVVAAVVIVSRPTAPREPQIVAVGPHLDDSIGLEEPLYELRSSVELPKPINAVPATRPMANRTMAKAVVPVRESVERPSLRRRHRVEPKEESQPLMTMASLASDEIGGSAAPKAVLTAAKQEPQTIAAPPSAVVEGPLATGVPERRAKGDVDKADKVVLVSSKRDLATGAPAATETEASNVLVGG